MQKQVKVCQEHLSKISPDIDEVVSRRYCDICRRDAAKKFYYSKKGSGYYKGYRASDKRKMASEKYQQSEKYKKYQREYRRDNRNNVKEKSKLWVLANKSKVKNYKNKHAENNKESNRIRLRQYYKKISVGLEDPYIIKILVRSGVSKKNISSQLIKIKRLFIKAKRLIKQEKKHVNKKQ